MVSQKEIKDFFDYVFKDNFLIISYKSGVLEKINALYNKYYEVIQREISPKALDLKHLFSMINGLLSNYIKDFKIAKMLTYHLLGFRSLLPLLIHEKIDEIFIDGRTGKTIIDFFPLGRFRTNIVLTPVELEKLILICKLQSGTIISNENPSLKATIETEDFLVRISIDFPPLVDAPQIDIRKIRKIDLKSFIYDEHDILMLSVLLIFLALRKNILIIGEPGSGKTTLASVLLNNSPSYWRIIAIEDVRELNISRDNLLRIKVRPFESQARYSKEREILKLLHRSPDYVFIGELQDYNDFKAFFHALSAGIKCIATSHSNSLKNFERRLINNFKIEKTQLEMIDLIVLMKRKITDKVIERRISKLFVLDENGKHEPFRFDKLPKVIPGDFGSLIQRISSAIRESPNSVKSIVEEINRMY